MSYFPKDKTVPNPFIVGVSRSGTTLLRMMLDNHSELAIPPETHFISQILNLRSDTRNLKRQFVDVIVKSQVWGDFEDQLSIEELRVEIDKQSEFSIEAGLRCFYNLYAYKQQKLYWGDKTPQYIYIMNKIAPVLPESSFIHVIRDGRDVSLSGANAWFGPNSIYDQAKNWVATIKWARQQAKYLEKYMEIRYEDLVSDTENTLRNICDFINLSFEPQLMEYHRNALQKLENIQDRKLPNGRIIASREMRISIHMNLQKPPDKNLIGQWKRKMNTEQLKQITNIAGEMLTELGYEV